MTARGVEISGASGPNQAGVAKLGQRRWDEVPVLTGSQVQILPPALSIDSSLRDKRHPSVA